MEKNELIGCCVYTIKNGKKGPRFVVIDLVGTDTYLLQAVGYLDGFRNYCIVRTLDWFKDKLIVPPTSDKDMAQWYYDNIENHAETLINA